MCKAESKSQHIHEWSQDPLLGSMTCVSLCYCDLYSLFWVYLKFFLSCTYAFNLFWGNFCMKSEVEVQLHFFAFVYTVVLISFTEKKKKLLFSIEGVLVFLSKGNDHKYFTYELSVIFHWHIFYASTTPFLLIYSLIVIFIIRN